MSYCVGCVIKYIKELMAWGDGSVKNVQEWSLRWSSILSPNYTASLATISDALIAHEQVRNKLLKQEKNGQNFVITNITNITNITIITIITRC